MEWEGNNCSPLKNKTKKPKSHLKTRKTTQSVAQNYRNNVGQLALQTRNPGPQAKNLFWNKYSIQNLTTSKATLATCLTFYCFFKLLALLSIGRDILRPTNLGGKVTFTSVQVIGLRIGVDLTVVGDSSSSFVSDLISELLPDSSSESLICCMPSFSLHDCASRSTTSFSSLGCSCDNIGCRMWSKSSGLVRARFIKTPIRVERVVRIRRLGILNVFATFNDEGCMLYWVCWAKTSGYTRIDLGSICLTIQNGIFSVAFEIRSYLKRSL